MEIEYSRENSILIITLFEDIDQHTTDKIRRKIDNEIENILREKLYLILVTLLLWIVRA